MIRSLEEKGETGSAELFKTIGSRVDAARDLAYRLFNICERKGWAQEALAYNSLITAWSGISRRSLTIEDKTDTYRPGELF